MSYTRRVVILSSFVTSTKAKSRKNSTNTNRKTEKMTVPPLNRWDLGLR